MGHPFTALVSPDGFYGGKFAFDTFSYLRVSLNNPSWYVHSHTPYIRIPKLTLHRVDKVFSFRFPPYKV